MRYLNNKHAALYILEIKPEPNSFWIVDSYIPYHINRLVLSVFAGYGIPIYLTEEGESVSGETKLNEGYDRDLRLGLTVGFAF